MPGQRILPILLLVLLMPLGAIRAAELQRGDLLLDGASDRLWLARIQQADAPARTLFTRLELRTLPAGDWRQLTEIAGRAVLLTSRESEFVLLLDSGDWWYGKAPGAPLPERGVVRLLAGQGATLYAVGAPNPSAGTTAPATDAPVTTSPAATAPSTRPAHEPAGATLYRLDKSTWIPLAPLPPEVSDGLSAHNATMALANGKVMIARLLDDGGVATYTWSPDTGWTARPTARPPFEVAAMKLLDTGRGPALWVAAQAGPGALYFGADQWGDLHALKVDADLSKVTGRDITVAAERIRLLYVEDGRLYQQQFSETGEPLGAVAEMVLPKPPDQRMLNFIQLAMMFALMFLLMGSIRRRPVPQDLLQASTLRVAPMWQRLAAGIIDASPYFAGLLIYASRVDDTAAHLAEPAAYPAWIGLGIYFLHITLLEMIRGQSIGKMIFGLRVVTLEGQKPRPGAILIRNLVLMIEVFLMFPLILVFYSPLRQRIGDMSARTLVVANQVPGEPPPPPPQDPGAGA